MPLGFLVPAFLAGLAALLVPLVLHLRRRDRRKPRPFPSLMFLERLPVQTDQKRRITDWPLLLLRAIALALLVAAFARPFLRDPAALTAPDAGLTVVLLDRSASIAANGSNDALVDSAVAVIGRLPAGRRMAVVAFDASATILLSPTTDHAAALAAVAALPEPAGATRFSAGLRAASQLLVTEPNPGEIVLISDLQQSGLATGAVPGLPTGTTLTPIAVSPTTRDNTAITALEVEPVQSSNGRRVVTAARVARFSGDSARRVNVSLEVDGREVSTVSITLEPDAVARVTFDTTALARGSARLVARLSPDGMISDDVYHTVVPAEAVTRVMLVTARDARPDEHRFVEQALAIGRDPAFDVTRTTSLDAVELEQSSVVVLVDVVPPSGVVAGALSAWVSNGGGLVLAPGDRISSRRTTITNLPVRLDGSRDRNSGAMLGQLEHSHPALAGFQGEGAIGLGSVRIRRHPLLEPTESGEVLLRYDDAAPALVTGSSGSGRVAVVAIPFDVRRGDFPLQPGFLPFVRGVVGWAAGADRVVLSRQSGEAWLAPATVRDPVLRGPSGDLLRPGSGARSVTLRENGIYDVFDGGSSGLPIAALAVNGTAAESNLAAASPDQLLIGVSDLPVGNTVPAADEALASEARQQGWRWILLTLLLVLVVESVIASRGWRGVGANPILEREGRGA